MGRRRHIALARALTYRAVAAYWRRVQDVYWTSWALPALFVPLPSVDVPRELGRWATRLGTRASELETTKASYCLGTAYAAMLPREDCFPLIWAEAVASDGRFVFRADRRNHKPYFRPNEEQEWLVTRGPCVLLQRTTAKEQTRRLVAAALPSDFVAAHRGVVIGNHLNMLRPTVDNPALNAEALTAFLNSRVADQAFRCVSGSVAVSAYEIESLPLPPPEALGAISDLVAARAPVADIERACTALYGM